MNYPITEAGAHGAADELRRVLRRRGKTEARTEARLIALAGELAAVQVELEAAVAERARPVPSPGKAPTPGERGTAEVLAAVVAERDALAKQLNLAMIEVVDRGVVHVNPALRPATEDDRAAQVGALARSLEESQLELGRARKALEQVSRERDHATRRLEASRSAQVANAKKMLERLRQVTHAPNAAEGALGVAEVCRWLAEALQEVGVQA